MSTRSNIAIELPNKKVKVIYVHSDGYPYGIGKILNKKYSTYKKAIELFNFGDASYLDDTIETCSFYGRDWERDIDPAREYRDEWMFMRDLSGDIMIEYLYLFQNNIWKVSEQSSVTAPTDHWDGKRENLYYWTKYIPLTQHKDFETKHEKHAEVKMISQIGKLLAGKFPEDHIKMQGAAMKKKAN